MPPLRKRKLMSELVDVPPSMTGGGSSCDTSGDRRHKRGPCVGSKEFRAPNIKHKRLADGMLMGSSSRSPDGEGPVSPKYSDRLSPAINNYLSEASRQKVRQPYYEASTSAFVPTPVATSTPSQQPTIVSQAMMYDSMEESGQPLDFNTLFGKIMRQGETNRKSFEAMIVLCLALGNEGSVSYWLCKTLSITFTYRVSFSVEPSMDCSNPVFM